MRCDEARPSFIKCLDNGIVCAGYGIVFRLWQDRQSAPAVVQQPSQNLTPFVKAPALHERHLFDFFRKNFVSKASFVFESELWSRTTILACQQYPAVWHAALAIAAFFRQSQRQREAGANGAANVSFVPDQWLQDEDRRWELEHCNRAIRCLIGLQHSPLSYANQEMVLITSLLLTRYYRLRRSPAEALIQVRNGLNLLNKWAQWHCSGEQPCEGHLPGCVAKVSSIWLLFVRHYIEIYGSVIYSTPIPSTPLMPLPSLSNTAPFRSLDEACEELFMILCLTAFLSWEYCFGQ